MYGNGKAFVEEREFSTDCKLLAKALPELIGLDGATTRAAERVIRRFIAMHETISLRIEQVTQSGELPPPKLIRAAEFGMKRLLEMAALNQRSAVEYVKATQREQTLGGLQLHGLLSDGEIAEILNSGDSVIDLMDPMDRNAMGVPALSAPNDQYRCSNPDPLESAAIFATSDAWEPDHCASGVEVTGTPPPWPDTC